jgi:methionyl-tRNA formyltransferase
VSDLRAVVFAYSEVGHDCLDELLNRGVRVEALFTHEDAQCEELWFPSAAGRAREAGVPVFTPETLGDEEYRLLQAIRPDAIFSFYYRSMIGERFLTLAPRGAFNLHGSLLPKYRGRACINWAVLMGERETGGTLHYMVKRADAGDIVDQQRVPIHFDDTAFDVGKRVAEAARLVVGRNIDAIRAGTVRARPQDEAAATYFGRRTPADGRIDWSRGAFEIYNLVRAVTRPFPGAFAYAQGEKIFIWKAFPEDCPPLAPPGTVLSTCPLRVMTGRGRLRIISTRREGGPEMDGEALARGLGEGLKFE